MADTPKNISANASKSRAKGSKGGAFGGRAGNLFSVRTLTSIPGSLAMLRRFMNSVNWNMAQQEIEGELRSKVAILGLANSGKSTLFNALRGQYQSAVSSQEGTTTRLIRGNFGPFALIDTPGHLPDVQQDAVEEAAVVLYLLDASKGIRREDEALIRSLLDREKPLVVALNKSDLLGGGADEAAAHAAAVLHMQDIIPISAQRAENLSEELVPALIETSPEAAVIIGRELPQFRREAANKLVKSATLVSLVAGLEPIPLVDIPILLGNQIRLILRIAAVYGEPLTASHARELVATIAGGLALRYLAEQAAKIVPFGGDLVAGAIAAAGTYAIGQVAIEYFEAGKQLSRKQMNDVFSRYYESYREQRAQVGTGDDKTTTPALPAPAER